jgi:glutathione S-transferase
VDQDLEIRQIVVLSEGCLDAIVLVRFEERRDADRQSKLWRDRQERKVDGTMRAFNDMVVARKEQGKEYLVGDELTIADIAAVCTLGFIEFGEMRKGWQEKYPMLAKWWNELDARTEFEETRPVMFDLKESVV